MALSAADKALAKALFATAQQQQTLGMQLLAAGVQDMEPRATTAESVAVSWVLDDSPLPGECLYALAAALQGCPDESYLTTAMKALLLAPLTPVGPWAAFATVLKNTGGTLQKVTGSPRSLRSYLDEVAQVDPPAADLLADAIEAAQADYDSTYYANMAAAFGKGAWRGAKWALGKMAEGAGLVVREVVAGAAEIAGAAARGLGTTGLLVALAAGGIVLWWLLGKPAALKDR